ncbi:MAG: hypothetical protein ABIG68_08065 [Acidobacteriota bacterium]
MDAIKLSELGRTKSFIRVALRPRMYRPVTEQDTSLTRVPRALDSEIKYNLGANPIKSEIAIESKIEIMR